MVWVEVYPMNTCTGTMGTRFFKIITPVPFAWTKTAHQRPNTLHSSEWTRPSDF